LTVVQQGSVLLVHGTLAELRDRDFAAEEIMERIDVAHEKVGELLRDEDDGPYSVNRLGLLSCRQAWTMLDHQRPMLRNEDP
jgi:hypothetical protein